MGTYIGVSNCYESLAGLNFFNRRQSRSADEEPGSIRNTLHCIQKQVLCALAVGAPGYIIDESFWRLRRVCKREEDVILELEPGVVLMLHACLI